MATPAGMMICDPGPCDPGALTVVGRDFGLWAILLFAVTAFVAGRKASRANLVLPALCMMVIAVAFYLSFFHKVQLARYGFVISGGLSPEDRHVIEAIRWELLGQYATGYLAFALIPLGGGLALKALRQRKLKGGSVG